MQTSATARGRPKSEVILDAVGDVATPVIFGVGIIILVFLPLMTLEGMEGKMFAPLAYTIAIALAISLVLSLTLSPVLASFLLKGGSEHDTWMVRMIKRPYLYLLELALNNSKKLIVRVASVFAGCCEFVPVSLAPRSSRK